MRLASVPYASAIIRVDAAAGDQVWAEADDGTRLGVLWSVGFRGDVADAPVVVDPGGTVVARDGERIDVSGPLFHGYNVCASPTDILILEYQPG